jgi:glycosyltransferase involved in cell wall biosynthesis
LPYIDLKQKSFWKSSPGADDGHLGSSEGKRHIVFLLRKNPASIGGVQRHFARLLACLGKEFQVDRIAWPGPEWWAPLYLPYFNHKSVRNGSKIIFCDDAVTSLAGARIRDKSDKKVVAMAHGLDVILPIEWYQGRLRRALQRLDKVICVSRATAEQVKRRGVEESRIVIIAGPVEIVRNRIQKNEDLYFKIEHETGMELRSKKLLLSLGRPVTRKGFDYFAERILPHLPDDHVYLIAGPKPASRVWLQAVSPFLGEKLYNNLLLASGAHTVHEKLLKLSRDSRVFYLNGIDDSLRDLLFAASDLFIMPNRTVEGDMEGFGLVALEASVRGVPVIATGIEGIVDAVIDGKNGFCFAEGDDAGMIEAIKGLTADSARLREFGSRAKEYVEDAFSSKTVVDKYKDLFDELLNGGS